MRTMMFLTVWIVATGCKATPAAPGESTETNEVAPRAKTQGSAPSSRASSSPKPTPSASNTSAVIDCRTQRYCAENGHCTNVDGRCIATTQKDCTASTWCRTTGHCSLIDGRCDVLSNADCAASTNCQKLGACRMKKYPKCIEDPNGLRCADCVK